MHILVPDKRTFSTFIVTADELDTPRQCANAHCPASFPNPGEATSEPRFGWGYVYNLCYNDRQKIRWNDQCEVGRLVALPTRWNNSELFWPADEEGRTGTVLIRALTRRGGNLRCDVEPDNFPSPPTSSDGSVSPQAQGIVCAAAWYVTVTPISFHAEKR